VPTSPSAAGAPAGHRGPDWPVTEVELLESHLGPVPHYDRVAGWPVAADRLPPQT